MKMTWLHRTRIEISIMRGKRKEEEAFARLFPFVFVDAEQKFIIADDTRGCLLEVSWVNGYWSPKEITLDKCKRGANFVYLRTCDRFVIIDKNNKEVTKLKYLTFNESYPSLCFDRDYVSSEDKLRYLSMKEV